MRIRAWTRPVVIRRLRRGELQEIVRRTNPAGLKDYLDLGSERGKPRRAPDF